MSKALQIIKQLRIALGMEVKLEQMKLADGVTVIEADAFEPNMEVFVVTEDEQKIAVPVGEYELEDGRILVVVEEGIISEIKEVATEEEAPVEEEVEATATATATETAPKKTIEIQSTSKETYFEENEALKLEIVELKAQIELNEVVEIVEDEIKPITFNPENETEITTFKYGNKGNNSQLNKIFTKINN